MLKRNREVNHWQAMKLEYSKTKILFYIEPRIDLGNPYLREWWLNHFTLDIINTLKKSDSAERFEYCITINEPLAQKYGIIDDAIIKILPQKELFPLLIGDAVELSIAWYKETYTDGQMSYYVALMRKYFSDFVPDIIITFTPAPFLRKAFPDSLILHHEVSFLSEPPYPWVPYLDPLGMYFGHSSFMNKFRNEIKEIPFTTAQLDYLSKFKGTCQSIIRNKSPYDGLLNPQKEKFDHLVLLPLVGVNHYGFHGPCKLNIKNEYQFLVHILEQIPQNIGVVVTYPPQLLNPCSNETIAFLERQYPHFIYHEDFGKYLGVSQYLLAYVDMVVGLGSSICFQTLLWDKKFLDLGDMDFIADASDLDAVEEVLKRDRQNKDNILYWMLTRYTIQKSYLYNPEWLSKFFINSLDKFRNGGITFDFFEPIDSDEKIFESFMNGLDGNIPRLNPLVSYSRLKKFYDDFKPKCDGFHVFQFLEDMISKGVDAVVAGKRNEGFSIFSEMLERVNNIKGTLMNNMAIIHINEGRLDEAEQIFNALINEGFNIDAIRENLQKLQHLKNKITQTTPCVAENK